MGVRVIVEVLDHWQDYGLTASERFDLIVIAEVTSDRTRETRASLHTDYIRHRAGGKSPASWKNTISRLMRKGVLEHAVRGGREVIGYTGQTAQYRIPHLCPEQNHDGRWGQCKRGERHQSDDPPNDIEGHQSDDPVTGEGHQSDERGSSDRCGEGHQSDDPFPSVPQGPSSSSRSPGTAGSTANGTKRTTNTDLIVTKCGATPDEAQALLDDVRANDSYRSLSGFVRHLVNNDDMTERLRKLRKDREAATAPDPRDVATCTKHQDQLPCGPCVGDIKAGDTEIPRQLLTEFGPDARWDLAQNLNGEPR